MFRYCISLVLFFLLISSSITCAADATTLNRIAAVVNGEMITLHELKGYTEAEIARRGGKKNGINTEAVQKEVLDSLINDILFRQEAKRYQITVTEAELKEEIDKIVSRSGMSAAQFESGLKRQGLTLGVYKDRLRNSILRQRMTNYMIDRKVFVTREEVSDYYNKNKSQFAGEKTANFSILMLPSDTDYQGIFKQINANTLSFEDAARNYSADGSAKDGGKITQVPWDRLPPEMQKLLSSLADGKMSPLLRTQGGFVVIRRDAILPPKPLNLQEATPRIEEILLSPLREERFKEYTSQLRSKAVIDVRI